MMDKISGFSSGYSLFPSDFGVELQGAREAWHSMNGNGKHGKAFSEVMQHAQDTDQMEVFTQLLEILLCHLTQFFQTSADSLHYRDALEALKFPVVAEQLLSGVGTPAFEKVIAALESNNSSALIEAMSGFIGKLT